MTDASLSLTVWGCRGSIPAPGAATAGFGGDTSCYELSAAGRSLVVDCGSGMRALGDRLMREGPPDALDVLLTHPHFDHLIGLGFFAPLIARRTAVTLWTALPVEQVEDALGRLYSPPLWPVRIPGDYAVPVRALPAGPAGFGPFLVSAVPLNHPGGATGFRIEAAGRSLCIITDHEHGDPEIDARLARAVAGADLMLYDAPWSAEEYRRRVGWGHSSWREACGLAVAAGVARTLIVHHSPTRTDADLSRAEAELGAGRGRIGFARDGMRITL